MSVKTALTMCAGLLVLASAVAPAVAGDLDPPDSARPGGAPAPTMKSLDDIPGSWHRTVRSPDALGCFSSRFKCVMVVRLFGGIELLEAVLDRETGLVWEMQPDVPVLTWADALGHCLHRKTGGRLGWRLPSAQELGSLLVYDPFVNRFGLEFSLSWLAAPEDFPYWSATIDPYSPDIAAIALQIGANAGLASGLVRSGANGRAWCVRGGSGAAVP